MKRRTQFPEKKLQAATNKIPVLILYINKEEYSQPNNHLFAKWFELSKPENSSKYSREFIGKQAWGKLKSGFKAAMSGQEISYEQFLPYKNGSGHWVNISYIPGYKRNGEVSGVFAIIIDVSKQKEAKSNLLPRKEVFTKHFQTKPYSIFISRVSDDIIIGKNKCAEKEFGHCHSRLIGKPLHTLLNFTKTSKQKYLKQLSENESLSGFEAKLVNKTDGQRTILLSVDPIEINKDKCYLTIIRDITKRKKAKMEIKLWKDRYKKVVKASGMILYDVNILKERFTFSGDFTEITGFEVNAMSNGNSKFWLENIHSEDRKKYRSMLESNQFDDLMSIEYRIKRADGNYINVLDRGYAQADKNGKITRRLGLIEDVTTKKLVEEARSELAERMEAAREDECRQIAGYLHDDVGQMLASASIRLGMLESKLVKLLPEENSVLAEIVKIQELLKRNQKLLRDLAHSFHPGILEQFGLAEAISRFINSIRENSQDTLPDILLKVSPFFPRFKLSLENCFYRIVQEAITNALKHSSAKKISLKLEANAGFAVIMISDDGQGFNFDAKNIDGIGLVSMRERAEAIGANIKIVSEENEGTIITLFISLESSLH